MLCFGLSDALLGEPRQWLILDVSVVLFAAASVHLLLPLWCLILTPTAAAAAIAHLVFWARFCCCCRSFAVLIWCYLLLLASTASFIGDALFCSYYLVLLVLPFTYCLDVQVLASAADVRIHHLLSCCCSLLVLAAAAGVIIWNFWFVLCCVDVPIAEAQH
ncbi:hypothetical protein MAM1_0945d11377 [Mucor ambiguus]|uniref:Uncharacterized protein n=1 Tax=Mucor ambiguus TaxID=91626 RepID=A0A0C9MWQ0_9FUNG|nr:hypothetical protein MAM1_0945d11377 [Mucor ambiguus]